MKYIATGQISHISDITPYNKKGDNLISVVITQPNSVLNKRLEFIKIDFMKENVFLVEDKGLSVGDSVEIVFQIVGRKITTDDGKVKFYQNLQGLNINYL